MPLHGLRPFGLRWVCVLALGLFSQTSFADFCGSATNQAHVAAGRATQYDYVYARANGSGDEMGLYYSGSTTLRETAPGYYEVVDSCPPPVARPYDGASDRAVPTILDVSGRYGVAMGGGHFLQASGGDPSAFPREQRVITQDTLQIPAGATIRHAFLYYGGIIGLDGGDFTPDGLGNLDDIRGNGISFRINGSAHGAYDPSTRLPPNQSSIGSEARMADSTFHADFGTLTGTSTSFWSNRLDITGLMQGVSGSVTVEVEPPESLDVNVNDASRNGGNPAGSTLYNSCLGAANWGIVVIYEHPEAPLKQLILKDDIVRAWDYIWFHKGVWLRPRVAFDNHAPMREGAKFYVMAQTGNYAGIATPASPACTCGCGGTWNLRNIGSQRPTTKSGEFWSYTLIDPTETWNDPLHRDSTNGNWDLENQAATQSQAIRGNDWTLFQSGGRYTEFPNLYEGRETVADNIQPITQENVTNTGSDRYAGHPWNGRGTVRYHGVGNDLSVVEVEPDPSALELGSTSSALYFKGDQKDVFKPQERITVRFMMLEIPLEEDQLDQPPTVSLLGADPLILQQGAAYSDPGASAEDPEDGSLTPVAGADCGQVNTGVPGNYGCTWTATDSAGNTASATREITVQPVGGNQPPVVTLTGATSVTVQVGAGYSDAGATASDAEDGPLTPTAQADCAAVDTSVAGDYSCTWTATDSQGATGSATRAITVEALPNTPPVVTLTGNTSVTVSVGSSYSDAGATAQDAEDGPLTPTAGADCGAVNTAVAGSYSCTWTATDSQGATGSATRTVTVQAVADSCAEYTTSLWTHKSEGRAYSTGLWLVTYYATGSDERIAGSWWTTATLHRFSSEPGVYHVGACP